VVDNLILAVVQASDSHGYSVPQEYLGTLLPINPRTPK